MPLVPLALFALAPLCSVVARIVPLAPLVPLALFALVPLALFALALFALAPLGRLCCRHRGTAAPLCCESSRY